MISYPVKVALICLIAYGCFRVLVDLLASGNALFDFAFIIVGGLICLASVPFWFRAIYLVTVGVCRLGDGHPLLPPIIGAILAWVVAGRSLLNGSIGTGVPLVISLLILLGGPISITMLGHFEISRLRGRATRMNSHSAMARYLPGQPGPRRVSLAQQILNPACLPASLPAYGPIPAGQSYQSPERISPYSALALIRRGGHPTSGRPTFRGSGRLSVQVHAPPKIPVASCHRQHRCARHRVCRLCLTTCL